MELEEKDDHDRRLQNDDQHFLLNFIMGMYLGPDVTFDNQRSSGCQRLAKDSLPYTSIDLGPSYVSMALLENLYYYLLRKADPSLILKPHMLHKYLKGSLHFSNLTASEDSRQFSSFFPLDLHEQIWYPKSFRVVKGIVLIDDPITSHGEVKKDLEKFRSLSRLSNFKIDMDEFVQYEHNHGNGNDDSEQNCLDHGKETTITGHKGSDGNAHLSTRSHQKFKRRRDDYDSMPTFPEAIPMAKHYICKGEFQRTHTPDGRAIMSLLSIPEVQKCTSESDASIVLSGAAGKGKPGPPVGVVDVGVSKIAYYFRVALPGVRKDYCKFSCEIESAGKVRVRGLTTGGKTIRKPSRVFEMKFQQLCPPGPFTLSFSLPGPVDPRLFAPNFSSDGIFEGVIIKHTRKSDTRH